MKIWKDGVVREMTKEEIEEIKQADKEILTEEGETE